VKEKLETIRGVRSVDRVNSENGSLLSVKLTCEPDSDLRETVYRQIKQTDWLLMEFRQETRTLETIFRELTREN
jgi:ABC-2 type transport system ATP-binding protein